MKITKSFYWVLIYLVFFHFSCENHEDVIPEKDITVEQVQKLVREKQSKPTNGGQTEGLSIKWEHAQSKDVLTGKALEFPVENTVSRFIQAEGQKIAYPVETRAKALAYRSENGTLVLDLVQSIPTEHSKSFTGFVSVSDWNGNPKHVFEYRDGQYVEKSNNGRTEDLYCFWLHEISCVTVTSGGIDYEKDCEVVSTLHCHSIDTPPVIAPDDFGDPGGGGGGSGGDGSVALCPHPTISGEFVPCEEDEDLLGFRICDYINIRFDRIPGDDTEDSFTAEIQNIYVPAFHSPSNLNVHAFWGAWCVTYGTSASNVNSSFDASNIFKEVWFFTTTEIEVWLNSLPAKPTDAEFSIMYKSMFETNLQIAANGTVYVTGGGCLNTSRTRLRYCK